MFIAKTKMSEVIRSEWKQKQTKEKITKISIMLDFMEGKAIDLQPRQSEKLSDMPSCEKKVQREMVIYNTKSGSVKSVKYHLIRIIGDITLTYDEYDTVLRLTEAFLNSRPIRLSTLFKCINNGTLFSIWRMFRLQLNQKKNQIEIVLY